MATLFSQTVNPKGSITVSGRRIAYPDLSETDIEAYFTRE